MIITGCSAFAHVVGHMRTEAELLPQLWEQVIQTVKNKRALLNERKATVRVVYDTLIVRVPPETIKLLQVCSRMRSHRLLRLDV